MTNPVHRLFPLEAESEPVRRALSRELDIWWELPVADRSPEEWAAFVDRCVSRVPSTWRGPLAEAVAAFERAMAWAGSTNDYAARLLMLEGFERTIRSTLAPRYEPEEAQRP